MHAILTGIIPCHLCYSLCRGKHIQAPDEVKGACYPDAYFLLPLLPPIPAKEEQARDEVL